MKRRVVFCLFCLVTVITSKAQLVTDRYSRQVSDLNTIILITDGNTTIKSTDPEKSDVQKVDVQSVMDSKGRVVGLKFPGSRPEFKIKTKQRGDTLFIYTPQKFNYGSIGINTYVEYLESVVSVPAGKRLIIPESDNIRIDGGFTFLDLRKAKSIELDFLRKADIRKMVCSANEPIKLNNMEIENTYQFEGYGDNTYYLSGDRIQFNMK